MKNTTFSACAKLLLSVVMTGLLLATTAGAQSSAGGGSIQGTVKDESGSAIPGAKVIIRNLATGVETNMVTNEEGFYSTPALIIGNYKIRVEATGMKAWEGNLQLETGRTAVVNSTMSVGAFSETVQVTGDVAELVTTTDPTVANTLDSRRIGELPINGRDLNTLLLDVTPGLEPVATGGVRVGGLMLYSTDYVQDGAMANDPELGGSRNIQGLDSIGEVRIETSTSSARFNRPATVIVTTKSGSNRLHGSLFETHRNNAFGVARARQDVLFDGSPFKAPTLVRNELGGSIGGPVFLPRFGEGGKALYDGRNRTFFFFSREHTRFRNYLSRDYNVPTAAMRAGDFSGLTDSQGRAIIIYDPLTTRMETINGRQVAVRDPFPGNIIPLSRISPLAKRLFEITPLPNDIVNPLIGTNLKVPRPAIDSTYNPTVVRIDHKFSASDNLYFKASGGRLNQFFREVSAPGSPTLNNETNVTYQEIRDIAGVVNWTHVFSPQFFVETNVNRAWKTMRVHPGRELKNWSSELGLPNPFGDLGWPSITSLGLTDYTYQPAGFRSLASIVTNIDQNYTLIRGTHNLQFGFRYHHDQENLQLDQSPSGSTAFNSLATALHSPTLGNATTPLAVPQTGFDLANFFLGYGASHTVRLNRQKLHITEHTIGLYAQDNYKVTDRLTLTPGVRWDISPAITERDNLFNSFDMKSRALVLPEPLDYYYRLARLRPRWWISSRATM